MSKQPELPRTPDRDNHEMPFDLNDARIALRDDPP